MDINKYLRENKSFKTIKGFKTKELFDRVICEDGFSMSVQASSSHWCNPREDDADYYSNVEIGYPSEEQIELKPFAFDNSTKFFGCVPVSIVDEIIKKHGGFKNEKTTNASK